MNSPQKFYFYRHSHRGKNTNTERKIEDGGQGKHRYSQIQCSVWLIRVLSLHVVSWSFQKGSGRGVRSVISGKMKRIRSYHKFENKLLKKEMKRGPGHSIGPYKKIDDEERD